jgi:hypothetical protein
MKVFFNLIENQLVRVKRGKKSTNEILSLTNISIKKVTSNRGIKNAI